MIDEMQALKNHGARELTDPQEGKQKIGCQRLLALKHNTIIQMYKTRMVAKRFTKACSIDHPGFFSPVAKLNSIRLFLSAVANFLWSLHLLNVKNGFLHLDVEKPDSSKGIHTSLRH